jgi:acetoin utilization protein AcuB
MLMPPISQYMSPPPPIVAPPTTTMNEANLRMRRHAIHHLPVVRDGRVVGVVSDGYLDNQATVPFFDPDRVTLEEVMIRDVVQVGPKTPLAEAVQLMLARGVGSVLILEHGELVGLFTTSDALRALTEITARVC